MNLVDSSAWLEFFADGNNASKYEKVILDVKKLLVPSLCIFEVFKKVLGQKGEDAALQSVALMQQGRIVELTVPIALAAGRIGVAHKLPSADSIILATARQWDATLWTQDNDFKGLEGVKYFSKN